MSKLIPFPTRGQYREEASLWLARIDRGLTDAERRELAGWTRRAGRRDALAELARLWGQLDQLEALAELFPRKDLRGAGHRGSRWLVPAAAAAGVVMLGLALGLLWLRNGPGLELAADALTRQAVRPAATHYETAVGELRTLALPDGSRLTLNTDSRLDVSFPPGSREIALARGEAHFEVAHDGSRPFRVRVGDRIVEAVGTAFTVQRRDGDGFEVVVTDGRVRVARAGEPPQAGQLVGANQSLQVVPGVSAQPAAVSAEELEARLAWQQGMLLFRGESLEDVLATFGRYSPERFRIDDPALRTLRVGGYFRAGDVDALLLALRENFQINAEQEAGGTILLRAAARR
jgi:transmembrane sensor